MIYLDSSAVMQQVRSESETDAASLARRSAGGIVGDERVGPSRGGAGGSSRAVEAELLSADNAHQTDSAIAPNVVVATVIVLIRILFDHQTIKIAPSLDVHRPNSFTLWRNGFSVASQVSARHREDHRMRKSLAALAAVTLPLAFPATAMAQSEGPESYVAQLGELNDSGASGSAEVTLDGDQLTVSITASGLLADQPHAQHIHYPEEEEGAATIEGSCPDSSADADGNGLISTPEGAPFYGGIVASLTTEGDASPDSALAVERFGTAPGGAESYNRTFTVPEGFDAAEDLGESVIVVHGIDVDGNGEYDMDAAGPSELNPDLPAEATHPALCGALSPAAAGGAPTGLGGSNGVENSGLILAGLTSLAAAAGVVGYSRRRSEQA